MAGETGQAAFNARSKLLHQIRPRSHKRPAVNDQFGVEVVDGVYDHCDEVAKNLAAKRRLRGAAGGIKQLDQAVGQAAPPGKFQAGGNPDQSLHATAIAARAPRAVHIQRRTTHFSGRVVTSAVSLVVHD